MSITKPMASGSSLWNRTGICAGRALKGMVGAMLVVALCALPEGAIAAGPTVAGPVAKARQSVPPRGLKNAHLHLTSTAKLPPAKSHRTVRPTHHSVRHPRVVIHRGYATITGTVRDSGNRAVAGAHVHLTRPGGRAFRSRRARHATITNTAGAFTMHRVRPRAYRVGASKKKLGNGHVAVRLVAPGAPPVVIKIGAAAAPAHPRRHK